MLAETPLGGGEKTQEHRDALEQESREQVRCSIWEILALGDGK